MLDVLAHHVSIYTVCPIICVSHTVYADRISGWKLTASINVVKFCVCLLCNKSLTELKWILLLG